MGVAMRGAGVAMRGAGVATDRTGAAGPVSYRPSAWVLPTAPNLSGFRIR
jgi:hypothetical protein